MEFFNKYFGSNNHTNNNGEMFVKCPFPHYDNEGNEYREEIASAHVNSEKSIFHCKVCGESHSETSFLAKVQGISYKDALILLGQMGREGDWEQQHNNLKNSEGAMEMLRQLGIDSMVDDLFLGYEGEGIGFPVIVYGDLLDVRTYRPGKQPKVLSRSGKKSLILPFDLWVDDERPTLLCAGEKDMAIARAKGFNAITFTGGEQAFPKLFKKSFEGKDIYILYDNDEAGRTGAQNVAVNLKEVGANPFIVSGHYEVCTEKGEDIHDFFQKYHRTPQDLQKILDETPLFTDKEYFEQRDKLVPLVSLEESTQGKYDNQFVSSRVQVVATFEEVYKVPEYVTFQKYDEGKSCTMLVGTEKIWSLDESNARDILYLMDSNLKEDQVKTNLRKLSGIPQKEKFIRTTQRAKTRIFKAVVTDDVEKEVVEGEETSPLEIVVYSFERMKAGEKYRITYKPVNHPLQAQKIVGIITKVERSDSTVDSFRLTPGVRDLLRCFQKEEWQTVDQKMAEIYERIKAFAGNETRKDIAFAVELFYHTPLQFKFGKRTERAYLEPMIVGESRTGKSQTAKKLLEMYELGVFTSLKTASTVGLIGGSDNSSGGWKTKIGLIPRNHKGAVIIEEFSGGGKEFIKKLTDIRSSNMVRITRAAGTLNVPAMVRMLSISNQQTQSNGMTIPLKNYPNGIKVLLDLVGAAEDIARYDFFLLVDKPSKSKGYISPLDDTELYPFPKDSYLNRIRWIWSRKADQIRIERDVMEHIVEMSNELNEKYDCHINFFGAEAWKKLSRLSIAVAGTLCSMDETGEFLVVKKEHVDWAKNFLITCYDNELFKLKKFVDNERMFTELDDKAVNALQGIYNKHATMLKQMEMSTDMSQKQLQAVSGLDQKDFASVLNKMAEMFFFEWHGDKIVPSQRFREGMTLINKNTYIGV